MNPRRAAPTNHNRNEQLRRETTLAGSETYEPAPTNQSELQADRDVQVLTSGGRAGGRA
jgi:hypothetical protein